MLKDKISHFENQFGLAASLSAGSDNTGDVDLQGYSACNIVCAASPGGNSNDEITFKVEHGDTTSSYENVDADDLLMDYGANDGAVSSGVFATIAGDGSDQIATVGYIGGKRYIKITADEANGNVSHPVSVVLCKEALQQPVSD